MGVCMQNFENFLNRTPVWVHLWVCLFGRMHGFLHGCVGVFVGVWVLYCDFAFTAIFILVNGSGMCLWVYGCAAVRVH